jgi:hypothetical protein
MTRGSAKAEKMQKHFCKTQLRSPLYSKLNFAKVLDSLLGKVRSQNRRRFKSFLVWVIKKSGVLSQKALKLAVRLADKRKRFRRA